LTQSRLADLFPLMVSVQATAKLLIFLLFVLVCSVSNAQENLGELKVDRFFLEPTFSSNQRTYDQGFSIGRSYLGASWYLDTTVSGHFVVGPKFMILKPARYGEPTSRDLGIVEAFGEFDTALGVLRAGLIPIPFGFYGLKNEAQQSFPNDLFYQSRFLQRRDYGASYFISYNNFTTTFAGHNGESGPDVDQRYWMTGRWSYRGPASSEVGISGSAGRWFEADQIEQRIRMGNLFAGFKLYGLGLAAEATMLSIFENNEFTRQAYQWHVDLEHPLADQIGVQMRYDFLEPHHGVLNDQIRELTLGLNYHTSYWNSVLYTLATTRWQEGTSEPHSSIEIVWKLTPLTQH